MACIYLSSSNDWLTIYFIFQLQCVLLLRQDFESCRKSENEFLKMEKVLLHQDNALVHSPVTSSIGLPPVAKHEETFSCNKWRVDRLGKPSFTDLVLFLHSYAQNFSHDPRIYALVINLYLQYVKYPRHILLVRLTSNYITQRGRPPKTVYAHALLSAHTDTYRSKGKKGQFPGCPTKWIAHYIHYK